MLKINISIFLLLLGVSANSQNADTVFYNLSSPYQTVLTHFNNLSEDDYHPEVAAKAFDPNRVEIDVAERLAIKLKQAFDGAGIDIELDNIPKTED